MPRNPPVVKKTRVNMDVHPEIKALVLDLQERTSADSMSEVVRRAVKLYDLMLTEHANGSELLIKPKLGLTRQLLLF